MGQKRRWSSKNDSIWKFSFCWTKSPIHPCDYIFVNNVIGNNWFKNIILFINLNLFIWFDILWKFKTIFSYLIYAKNSFEPAGSCLWIPRYKICYVYFPTNRLYLYFLWIRLVLWAELFCHSTVTMFVYCRGML